MAGNNGGAVWMDPRGKSDFDAGLLFLAAVARMMPGLTWQDLQTPQFMSGWLTDLSRSVGNLKDGIGDVLKDTFKTVGGGAGDAVRLATDPKVADTVSRAATAYATGGASEGANSLMDALGSIFSGQGQQAVQQVGQSYKQSYGFNLGNPWVIGGGIGAAALLVVLVARR